ncbi:restriction endonuclease subunit S [Methylobacter tundripaludum]|uniref:Restriction modification system protein containing a DNA specificity domain n=1 Tax=Methylobacter tundripaludum (strain ATCC BAA-1195 / DSM 17260 / SV96) TaxID=697282 RepID=G3IRM2_METTV|nr:restriction endonuclease subunit S [Methylobacter tundripaludum]EGW23641.1 restriction modification system protein containing a DNA specificity domain [Methylobacter tundripaludum SV96]
MSTIQTLLTDHIDIWTAADTAKKSGRGRSSNNAASVYGIKKLRELILELAVRGKLVPQDANDEPASELLKRIQAEKAKLIAEGKIKRKSPLTPLLQRGGSTPIAATSNSNSPPFVKGGPGGISVEEKPFELPKGWEWVHLPDVSDYKVGKTPSTKSSVYWTNSGDGFNWVSIADLNHDDSVFETNKQITDKAVSEVFRSDPAPAGTILMSFKLTLGKISILDKPAFHNEAIISIYPNQSVFKDFLFKVLPARAMAGNSKSAIKGNTLNSESIAALMIPLPPMAEQQRIVAKVDELMALCDQLETQHSNAAEAHEKLVSHLLGTLTQSQNADDFSANWQRIAAYFDILFTTETSIDALKQTLLQLAVMGKLVPQDPNDEPAGELLKRIQTEKAKLIAEGKIKKDKQLPPITDDEKPFGLPEGWEWIKVSEVAELITSGSRDWAQYLSNEGAKFVTMGNLSRGSYELRLGNMRHVNPPKDGEGSRTKLEANDLLISITGDVGNLGRIPEDFGDAYINQHTCLLRFVSQCRNRYFPEVMRSPMAAMQFNAPQRGIKNSFRLGDLDEMVIPLPPLAEQHRIVAKVDELMALCDQLKTRITEANQLQQKLADVVVERAIS